MASQKIMIIRHAEKPNEVPDPPITVMRRGDNGASNLTPRGWQRAGALVRFFAPRGEHDDRPVSLFATEANDDFPSLRTRQTLAPLAEFFAIDVGLPAPPDGVEAAAKAILKAPGPCLVAWEHKNIAKLIAAITGDQTLAPHWSGDRFDVVLVLTSSGSGWNVAQQPQMLLAGDSKKPLRARRPGEDR